MDIKRLNMLQSFLDWKEYVDLQFVQLNQKIEELEENLKANQQGLVEFQKQFLYWHKQLSSTFRFVFVRRHDTLVALRLDHDSPINEFVGSLTGEVIVDEIISGHINKIILSSIDAYGGFCDMEDISELLEEVQNHPSVAKLYLTFITERSPPARDAVDQSVNNVTEQRFFTNGIALLEKNPDLIDFLAIGQSKTFPELAGTEDGVPLPFGEADKLPDRVPAQPKSRSVLFLHNNYYHFNTMAKALQQRGWDAVTVSIESPDSVQRQFYFGEDINLYHDDPKIRRKQIKEFLAVVPERFGALHFTGQGQPSFFTENFENSDHRTKIPWDFWELRRHRTVIGYFPSGCHDGASQTAIKGISDNVCGRCVWELRPDICNDNKSRAWSETLLSLCDWIGLEGDWAVEDRIGPKFVRGPIVACLDPDYWSPGLEVPEEMKVDRKPEEVLIYHAVGNLEERCVDGRDIKGSSQVEAAVKRLQEDGLPVKFIFLSKEPISRIRYHKVQADIIVDQLNYGRLGANARESFMLGRPVITRLIARQQAPLPPLGSIVDAPALDANEKTIEQVLRQLVLDPDQRRKMSLQSREFALKWFSSEVCAARFETIIDRVSEGMVPESDDLYPPTN